MRAFIQVIEAKDLYTRGHSERVSEGVGMLGRYLRLTDDRQSALFRLEADADTRQVYPFAFVLEVAFRIDASALMVTATVHGTPRRAFRASPAGCRRQDVTCAFHDAAERGPRMLARIAKRTGLQLQDL